MGAVLSVSDIYRGKESARQCRRCRRCQFRGFSVGKIPWRRKWQPTPVFLPGKSHGQRSLAGYSPWGCKELDMREHTHTHAHIKKNITIYLNKGIFKS